MEKTLKPLIDGLITLIQNGVDFVKGQIPDVAMQILRFKMAEAWLQLILSDILALLSIILFIFFAKRGSKNHPDEDMYEALQCIFCVVSVITIVIAIINTYSGLYTILEIYYAPKLFLLEYLKSFLGNQ
jgi:succinate dehydrogenase hydrophobic anchor subunit